MTVSPAQNDGASDSALFRPLKLGRIKLLHRVVMAPMTRRRVDDRHQILDIVAQYYGERASVPGTLLVTEAVNPSAWTCGSNGPILYTPEQVEAWKQVADAVHSKGSFIFMQMCSHGRVADQATRDDEGTGLVLSSSAVIMPPENRIGQGLYVRPRSMPRAMTEDEIFRTIREHADAARRAVFEAGFDGVEIHGAHGFLVDQFTQDTCNQRDDRWGGSIENRARFAVEVVRAVVDAIGADRTAIRFSPWNTFRGMGMEDPLPQYMYLVERLRTMGLAYLHLVDASSGGGDAEVMRADRARNYPLIRAWQGSGAPVIVGGGHALASATELVDVEQAGVDVAVSMGRGFISCPDLPFRFRHGLALNACDPTRFYQPAGPEGYLGYPMSPEWLHHRAGEEPRAFDT